MAKELPYFKFEPNQWDNGNIQICTKEEKGVFIDLCSMYWSRLGDVTYKLAVQKICGGNATALDSLCDNKIIEIIEGNIFIKYLSEQLDDFNLLSKTNSKNAKEGWEKRRNIKEECDRIASVLPKVSERDAIREEKRIKDKSKEKEIQASPLVYFPDDYILDLKYKEYLAFRKQIKKPLSEISIKANIESLKKLSKENNDVAVQILEQSIANGWQGLFELKQSKETQSPQSRLEKFIAAPTRLDKFLENTDNNSNFTI